jgi:hypothetical protein
MVAGRVRESAYAGDDEMTNTSGRLDDDGVASLSKAFDDAMRRVQAEFREMPGLQLTEAQAARLWCFDVTLCRAVLTTLVESHFLVRTRNASFARA